MSQVNLSAELKALLVDGYSSVFNSPTPDAAYGGESVRLAKSKEARGVIARLAPRKRYLMKDWHTYEVVVCSHVVSSQLLRGHTSYLFSVDPNQEEAAMIAQLNCAVKAAQDEADASSYIEKLMTTTLKYERSGVDFTHVWLDWESERISYTGSCMNEHYHGSYKPKDEQRLLATERRRAEAERLRDKAEPMEPGPQADRLRKLIAEILAIQPITVVE